MSLDSCPTSSASLKCPVQAYPSVPATTSSVNSKVTAIALPSGRYSLQTTPSTSLPLTASVLASNAPLSSPIVGKFAIGAPGPVKQLPLSDQPVITTGSSLLREVPVSTGCQRLVHQPVRSESGSQSSVSCSSAVRQPSGSRSEMAPASLVSRTLVINSLTRSVSSVCGSNGEHVEKRTRTDVSSAADTPIDSRVIISVEKGSSNKAPIIVKCGALSQLQTPPHANAPSVGQVRQLNFIKNEIQQAQHQDGSQNHHIKLVKAQTVMTEGPVVCTPSVLTTPHSTPRAVIVVTSTTTAPSQPLVTHASIIPIQSPTRQEHYPTEQRSLPCVITGDSSQSAITPFVNESAVSASCPPSTVTAPHSVPINNGIKFTIVKTELTTSEHTLIKSGGHSLAETPPNVANCVAAVEADVSSVLCDGGESLYNVTTTTTTTAASGDVCRPQKKKRRRKGARHHLIVPSKKSRKQLQNPVDKSVVRRKRKIKKSEAGVDLPGGGLSEMNTSGTNDTSTESARNRQETPAGTRRSSRIRSRPSNSPIKAASNEDSSIGSPTNRSPAGVNKQVLIDAAKKADVSSGIDQSSSSPYAPANSVIPSVISRLDTTSGHVRPRLGPPTTVAPPTEFSYTPHLVPVLPMKTTPILAKTTPTITKTTPLPAEATHIVNRTMPISAKATHTIIKNTLISAEAPPTRTAKQPAMLDCSAMETGLSVPNVPDGTKGDNIKRELAPEVIVLPVSKATQQPSKRKVQSPKSRSINADYSGSSQCSTHVVSSQQIVSASIKASLSLSASASSSPSSHPAPSKNRPKPLNPGTSLLKPHANRVPTPTNPTPTPEQLPATPVPSGPRSTRAAPIGPRLHVFNSREPHRCSLVAGGRSAGTHTDPAPASIGASAVPITCRLDAAVPGAPRVAAASAFGRQYDVERADPGWLCVFCRRRSHCGKLGDLLGPCFIARSPITTSASAVNLSSSTSVSNVLPASLSGTGGGRRKRRSSQRTQTTPACVKDLPPATLLSPDDGAARVGDLVETWFHQVCIAWCDRVVLNASRIDGIGQAIIDSLNETCVVCSSPGASVGCHARGCRSVFHVPCLLDGGGYLDYNQLRSTCPHHHRLNSGVSSNSLA